MLGPAFGMIAAMLGFFALLGWGTIRLLLPSRMAYHRWRGSGLRYRVELTDEAIDSSSQQGQWRVRWDGVRDFKELEHHLFYLVETQWYAIPKRAFTTGEDLANAVALFERHLATPVTFGPATPPPAAQPDTPYAPPTAEVETTRTGPRAAPNPAEFVVPPRSPEAVARFLLRVTSFSRWRRFALQLRYQPAPLLMLGAVFLTPPFISPYLVVIPLLLGGLMIWQWRKARREPPNTRPQVAIEGVETGLRYIGVGSSGEHRWEGIRSVRELEDCFLVRLRSGGIMLLAYVDLETEADRARFQALVARHLGAR